MYARDRLGRTTNRFRHSTVGDCRFLPILSCEKPLISSFLLSTSVVLSMCTQMVGMEHLVVLV